MKASPSAQKDLLRLQAFDSRALQLSHQLANLPQTAALTALGARVEDVRRRLGAATGELDDAKIELVRLESDVAVVEARIARDTERMRTSTSPRDAQALESELASLAKRRGDLEDIELTVMERVEDKERVVAAIEAERTTLADEVSVTEQEQSRARESLSRDQEQLGRDREALAEAVDADLAALYEKRRSAGGGIGAALLRARTCGGCNMSLTGADLEQVRLAPADDVVFCPECGRILVRTEESGL